MVKSPTNDGAIFADCASVSVNGAHLNESAIWSLSLPPIRRRPNPCVYPRPTHNAAIVQQRAYVLPCGADLRDRNLQLGELVPLGRRAFNGSRIGYGTENGRRSRHLPIGSRRRSRRRITRTCVREVPAFQGAVGANRACLVNAHVNIYEWAIELFRFDIVQAIGCFGFDKMTGLLASPASNRLIIANSAGMAVSDGDLFKWSSRDFGICEDVAPTHRFTVRANGAGSRPRIADVDAYLYELTCWRRHPAGHFGRPAPAFSDPGG